MVSWVWVVSMGILFAAFPAAFGREWAWSLAALGVLVVVLALQAATVVEGRTTAVCQAVFLSLCGWVGAFVVFERAAWTWAVLAAAIVLTTWGAVLRGREKPKSKGTQPVTF